MGAKNSLLLIILCGAVFCAMMTGCEHNIYDSEGNVERVSLENIANGWNLGNTFDAVCDNGQARGLALEYYWCGTKTDKQIFDDMKEAGMDIIRIPVSWHNHVDANDYTIDAEWLDRVNEVVDYAYDNDMYVILNIHHDISEQFIYPDMAHLTNSAKYVSRIWQQLSERFKEYDERLIFESFNENRLVGTELEWHLDNSLKSDDAVNAVNELNQVFVDTVRQSGGYNSNRYLMVSGYDTSIEGATHSMFKLPFDEKNKLILTVHSYIPYDFCLDEAGKATFDDSDKIIIDDYMKTLQEKFTEKDIFVIIGEYGVTSKDNDSERYEYTKYFADKAREYRIPCLWWDNHAFSGEGQKLGIYNRNIHAFTNEDILNAMLGE